MPTVRRSLSEDELDSLAGITGLGWTGSLLAYLSTIVGVGNAYVTRLVADPQSLLYVCAVCFAVTFGLDRLANLPE